MPWSRSCPTSTLSPSATRSSSPGVVRNFRRFYWPVRNQIEEAWIRHIKGIRGNQEVLGDVADLTEFLFGVDRTTLSGFRPILLELQHGQCFYCETPVRGAGDVDHFIPWRRYPADLGHNLVLADKNCNASKRDYLAGTEHLDRWVCRNREQGDPLARAFDQRGLPHNLPSTLCIAQWAYEQVESSKGIVWLVGDETVPLESRWRQVLQVPA